MSEKKLLTLTEAANRMGFKSRAFVYRQVKQGLMPKPLGIGTKNVRYNPAEIDRIAAARACGLADRDLQKLVLVIEKERSIEAAALAATLDDSMTAARAAELRATANERAAARAAEIKAIAESIAPVARGANPWD